MNISDFTRTENTTTTLDARVPNTNHLYLRIVNTTPNPMWNVYLIDYDDSIGAVGEFESEADALNNMDKFVELAIPAYNAKHAKYGSTPVIKFVNGELKCIVPELDDWEDILEEYRETRTA